MVTWLSHFHPTSLQSTIHTNSLADRSHCRSTSLNLFWQKKLEMVSLAWFQWHESTTSSNWTIPHPVTSHLSHINRHVTFEPHKSDQNQWIEPQNSTTLILAVNTNASNPSRSQHLRRHLSTQDLASAFVALFKVYGGGRKGGNTFPFLHF